MEKKESGKHSSMNGFAMMKGRVATVVLASALLLGGGLTAQAQNAALTTCSQSAATAIPQNPNWKANAAEWQKLKGEITLYMTNDMGRNGYYDQKPIAELMGEMAGTVDPECVLAVGDIHHFNGVASPQDPLWLTNYEYVYSHPDLMLDWFPVCGNHEYRGNTQAFMDYGKVSRRWMMPAKYYTKVFDHKGTTIRVIFLDTTPLIDSYRKASEKYPDACKQDAEAQLSWLDETLKNAKEDWVIVVCPVHSYGMSCRCISSCILRNERMEKFPGIDEESEERCNRTSDYLLPHHHLRFDCSHRGGSDYRLSALHEANERNHRRDSYYR